VLVLSVPCADPVDLETRFACQICFIDTSICETHELSPREVNPLPPKSKDSFGCSVRWAFVPLDPWHDPARGSQPSHRSANPAAQQQHSLTPLVAQLRASTFDNILTFRPLFLVSFIDASQTCSSSIALLLLTFTFIVYCSSHSFIASLFAPGCLPASQQFTQTISLPRIPCLDLYPHPRLRHICSCHSRLRN
jgi:hypothetical protein